MGRGEERKKGRVGKATWVEELKRERNEKKEGKRKK